MAETTYEAWTTARARTNYVAGGPGPRRHAHRGSGIALCGVFVSMRWGEHFFDPGHRRACPDCRRELAKVTS